MSKLLSKFIVVLFVFCGAVNAYAMTEEQEYEMICAKGLNEVRSLSRNIDPVEIHYVASINSSILELTDGTLLDTGIWWRDTFKTWQPGDALRISFYKRSLFYKIKIDNLIHHNTVWCHRLPINGPDIERPDARWIVNIESDTVVELNDGSQFNIIPGFSLHKILWKIGDNVMVVSYDKFDTDYPFYIANFSAGSIILCQKAEL